MTDSERIDALEAFAAKAFKQGHVWAEHVADRPDRLSQIAVPVRPLGVQYAELFQVPHFQSLRDAIDATVARDDNGSPKK